MKQLTIPISPLSVNKAWQGRRFKTKTYKEWQNEFLLLVKEKTPLKGKLSVIIEFFMKNDKVADIDNPIKMVLDTLKVAGVIEDDRFIYELSVYKQHAAKEFIRITISEL